MSELTYDELEKLLDIDELTQNAYLDGNLVLDDNTELVSRENLMGGNAKGTLERFYLDPIPYINALGVNYLEARTDEIRMNRKNMDYTGGASEKEKSLELFRALDVNGDGIIGNDDAMLVLELFGLKLTGNLNIMTAIQTSEVFPMEGTNELNANFPSREKICIDNKYMFFVVGGYSLPLYNCTNLIGEGYEDCETFERVYRVVLSKLNTIEKYGLLDAGLSSAISSAITQTYGNGTYLTYEQAKNWFADDYPMVVSSYVLNLLMPQYKRRVEVEDLNENFWVLSQVLSAVTTALWKPMGIVDLIKTLLERLSSISSRVERIESQLGLGNINRATTCYSSTTPVSSDMYSIFDISKIGIQLSTAGSNRVIDNIFTNFSKNTIAARNTTIINPSGKTFEQYASEVTRLIHNKNLGENGHLIRKIYDADLLWAMNSSGKMHSAFWQVLNDVNTNGAPSFQGSDANSEYRIRKTMEVILYDEKAYMFMSGIDGKNYLADRKTEKLYDVDGAFVMPRLDLYQGEMIAFNFVGSNTLESEQLTCHNLEYMMDKDNIEATIPLNNNKYKKIYLRNTIPAANQYQDYLVTCLPTIYNTLPVLEDDDSATRFSNRNSGAAKIQYINKEMGQYFVNNNDYWETSMIGSSKEVESQGVDRQLQDFADNKIVKEQFYEATTRDSLVFYGTSAYESGNQQLHSTLKIVNGGFCASKSGDGDATVLFDDYFSDGTLMGVGNQWTKDRLSYQLGLSSEKLIETSNSGIAIGNAIQQPTIGFLFYRKENGYHLYKKVRLRSMVMNIESGSFENAKPTKLYLYGANTDTNDSGTILTTIDTVNTYNYDSDNKTILIKKDGDSSLSGDTYAGYLVGLERTLSSGETGQVRFANIYLFGEADSAYADNNN